MSEAPERLTRLVRDKHVIETAVRRAIAGLQAAEGLRRSKIEYQRG